MNMASRVLVANAYNRSYLEIRRISVGSQPRQIVLETLSRKTLQKNRAGRGTQGDSPEFKSHNHKKKKIGVSVFCV
jgi:hypothetical protein